MSPTLHISDTILVAPIYCRVSYVLAIVQKCDFGHSFSNGHGDAVIRVIQLP